MDLNVENFTSPAITASNNICNKEDTSLKHGRKVQSHGEKIHGHLISSINRSGSVPLNASLPEIQRQCFTFHEAQSMSSRFDDDCGLALGLGCNRCSSLPKTTSSALVSFGTTSGGSFGTMQLSSSLTGKARQGQELHDGVTLHNNIEGHQNVASSKVSSICTHTGVSQNKSEIESKNCSRATVTKSLDIDPDILQLGLSTVSPEFRRQTVMNPVVVVSQSDGALILGQRQETQANGMETHRSTQVPVNESSTSALTKSRCFISPLYVAPRIENSGADSLPQLGTTSFITNHPLQNSPEITRTTCRTITSNGFLGNEEKRCTSKTCKFTGCPKGARGSSGLCISHGGGNRCQKSGCTKGAESRTVYCKAHGGGRRCQELGCTKSAEGKTDYCIGHGGGRRCSHQGCSKAARGRSGLCIRHGGGKRCQKEGCLKSAECYSSLCISHGGGRRCQYPDCTKGAQGSTLYCKAHGGGKRCTYTGCNKGAEGSTSLCKGHGGGKRCMFDGGGICSKSVHGGTQFCVAHGGGKRCSVEGCTKSARGRTDFCVRHGGGKRCKFGGCGKSAQGSTDFCKAHGGGKRCLWGQDGSVYSHEVHGVNGQGPCDRYARGKIGLCAAHSALVQDHRSHGGKALGPGIVSGLCRYQLKVFGGQFLTAENGGGGNVSATSDSPGDWETFDIVRHHKHQDRVHIRVFNGTYMQAQSKEQLTADYWGNPRWDDNAATFQMNIVANDLHGDYQLANGYGPKKAKSVYDNHRSSFIKEKDFGFLSKNGINTVRIPVGWWIAYDPNPPAPFIGGSLQALDNAFTWAQKHDIRVIVDLHAAPGSQNGMEHSASRDGSADWANSSQHISQSLQVIDFLASRYGNNSMLLGIELLNEPLVTTVSVDVLLKYYMNGYEVVQKHSPTAYVIMCQRIGKADPHELYQSNDLYSNIVVDVHYYNLFDPYYENLTVQGNIDFILNNRQPELLALNSANGPLIFVGEWTNEWKLKGASRVDYQRFGDAQLEVYEQASFGWSYWTLKNQEKHWDFEWNVKHKYLKSGDSRASLCKNISWKILTSFSLFGCLHLWIARVI